MWVPGGPHHERLSVRRWPGCPSPSGRHDAGAVPAAGDERPAGLRRTWADPAASHRRRHLGVARTLQRRGRRPGLLPGRDRGRWHGVYRVVARTTSRTGANRIGWMQTFPTYVDVLDHGPGPAGPSRRRDVAARSPGATPARRPPPRRRCRHGDGEQQVRLVPHAVGLLVGVGPVADQPAGRGSVRTGTWQDYSDGAGRVSRQNAGLYLDSQRNNGGGPRRLRHHARDPGRRGPGLRPVGGAPAAQERRGGRPRTSRRWSSSCPAGPEDYACGRRNITLAEVGAHSGTLTFGARVDTAQWSAPGPSRA